MNNYEFLKLGTMIQAAIDATTSGCKRFGADKAEAVISECAYQIRHGQLEEHIIENVAFETGVTIDHNDIQFVWKILGAEKHMQDAILELEKAGTLSSQKNGGVVDVG